MKLYFLYLSAGPPGTKSMQVVEAPKPPGGPFALKDDLMINSIVVSFFYFGFQQL